MRAAATTALLERGMAEAVIGGALVAVLEHFIGFVEFAEFMLAFGVARIAIGMMLHRQLAECTLELDLGAGARDAQNFVIVALGHRSFPAEILKNLVLKSALSRLAGRGLFLKVSLLRPTSCRPCRRPLR
jgi:hypothetical protein